MPLLIPVFFNLFQVAEPKRSIWYYSENFNKEKSKKFFVGVYFLQNIYSIFRLPSKTLAEPLGSEEPTLKNTVEVEVEVA